MEEMLEEKLLHELSQKNVKCCICTSYLVNEDNFMKVKDLSGKEITGSDEIDSDVKHIFQAICPVCGGVSFWEIESAFHSDGDGGVEDIKTDSIKLIYPLKPCYGEIPEPHEGILDDIKILYEMAAIAYHNIPQSCGTLLRLCLEKIHEVIRLEGPRKDLAKGDSLYDNIKIIFDDGCDDGSEIEFMNLDILKAMDTIRILGNEFTHETKNELDIKNRILPLFKYINFIFAEVIYRPTLTEEIEKAYNQLDDNKKIIKQK